MLSFFNEILRKIFPNCLTQPDTFPFRVIVFKILFYSRGLFDLSTFPVFFSSFSPPLLFLKVHIIPSFLKVLVSHKNNPHTTHVWHFFHESACYAFNAAEKISFSWKLLLLFIFSFRHLYLVASLKSFYWSICLLFLFRYTNWPAD